MKVAIIGGGAAGFFAAIAVKGNHPNAEVVIFEKTKRLLTKVKISGGGRCNVTNGCKTNSELSKGYPRGSRELKKIFNKFNNFDTIEWFKARGVPLIVQEDSCVFPKSQNSQSIIDCFLLEVDRLGIKIQFEGEINKIIRNSDDSLTLYNNNSQTVLLFNKVIITTGGSPRKESFTWLEKLGLNIETPIPSLFTFNMPSEIAIKELMGIVIENTSISIHGTKLNSKGDLLITHWGMSGPVILKLSSFGARFLYKKNYQFKINVNWINEHNHDKVILELTEIENNHSNKLLSNFRPYNLPERLWLYLLSKSELSLKKRWNELGKRGKNKLANILTNDIYSVEGKTTFRDEFVTCGGVNLNSIDINTMQSKSIKNIYFAGEVIDIDGITGGYNFQAAWSTAFIAGKLLN